MSPNLAEVRDDAGPGMAAEAPARKPSVLERAGTGPSPGARPRVVKTHPWVRGVTQLLRRGHLYAGLLMLPWVFLYGITGLLFNHPTWFSDQVVIVFGRSESKGTPIETLPGAAEVAVEVVRAINARGGEVYRLVSPRDARYERGGLGATVVTRDGRAYSVSVDPDGGGGSAREARGSAAGGRGGPRGGPPAVAKTGRGGDSAGASAGQPKGAARPERVGERGAGAGAGAGPTSPFEVRAGLGVGTSLLDSLRAGLPAVLSNAGLSGAEVTEVRAAPLSFLMEGGGGRWLVSYAIQSGSVTGRPADAATAAELSTRRFLLRMHTSHGYPSTFNAKWVWAVIVDAMSLVMVFWGITGVVMWWQIKRTRRLGTVVMALSLVAAAWVCAGMHGLMGGPGGG